MTLCLPSVFFLHPLHHVALVWPRGPTLAFIGILIWSTVAVLAVSISLWLRRRKRIEFIQHLRDKYGVEEKDEDWDEEYGAEKKDYDEH